MKPCHGDGPRCHQCGPVVLPGTADRYAPGRVRVSPAESWMRPARFPAGSPPVCAPVPSLRRQRSTGLIDLDAQGNFLPIGRRDRRHADTLEPVSGTDAVVTDLDGRRTCPVPESAAYEGPTWSLTPQYRAIAFGDMPVDIPMFGAVGLGIAMATRTRRCWRRRGGHRQRRGRRVRPVPGAARGGRTGAVTTRAGPRGTRRSGGFPLARRAAGTARPTGLSGPPVTVRRGMR